MTSVGSILGGAFGLVRRHPLSVLVWGLLYVAAVALLVLAMRPLFAVYGEMFSQQLANGGKQPLTPQELQPYVARMQSAGGVVFLTEIGIFAFILVLFTATQRAVLRPAERGFAFLRLGGDELRMIGLGLVLAVLVNVCIALAVLLLMIPVVIVGIVSGSPVASALLAVAESLLLMGATIYLEVRLSLVFPLSFLRRGFLISEAWELGRGRFWTLFGAYFILGLLAMTLFAILLGVAFAPFFSELAQGAGRPETVQLAVTHLGEQLLTLDARNVALLVGGALLSGLNLALFGGAMATAVRDLTAGGSESLGTGPPI